MSALDLNDSLLRAEARLSKPRRERRVRSDRGHARFGSAVEKEIARIMSKRDRPSMAAAHRRLRDFCTDRALPCPSRATLYNAVERVPTPRLRVDSLPPAVARCLYNVDLGTPTIAGDLVAFYAFNHGDTRALSFAAGLPWLSLLRAGHRTGWRPKSLGLLRTVLQSRGIDP